VGGPSETRILEAKIPPPQFLRSSIDHRETGLRIDRCERVLAVVLNRDPATKIVKHGGIEGVIEAPDGAKAFSAASQPC